MKKLAGLKETDFSIAEFKGHLLHDEGAPIALPKKSAEKMKKVLFAKDIKLNNVFVEINPAVYNKTNPELIELYSYAINYSVTADGEVVEDNLSVYKADDLFSDNNFLEPYELSLSYLSKPNGDIEGVNWEAKHIDPAKPLSLWSWKGEDGENYVRIDIPVDGSWQGKRLRFSDGIKDYQISARPKDGKIVESTVKSEVEWVSLPREIHIDKPFTLPYQPGNVYYMHGDLWVEKFQEPSPSLVFLVNLDFKTKTQDGENYAHLFYQYNFVINFVSV
ncbi:hypothetical protein JN01_0277 [Entomoplasma freundtii]|uniref:Uncharacterized protein n=1 Tax=Entomoplasma freundtii TaxID=74700 RepID=A0A2K8NR65_9MOLU|nr:hypothetical protein [Entomoplasma freundtii]ATZ16309.1 hypothetical protein EFREU_v1c02830 [Entomoplasma freundtii]TDY56789.1 hypothetical protein JN01_0277 [Entomoplasma freundtii]